MSKYSEQEKLEAVLRCVDEDMSYRHSAHILGCDPKLVEQWVKLYQVQGKRALETSHKHFSGEFKLYVVEYMYENQLSQMETAVLFGIPNRASVGNWARIYNEKGPQGLCKNRLSGIPGMKQKNENKAQPDKKTEAEYLAEIQQLRMENAYLKKLQTLVQERIAQESGKKSEQ